ncbi:MAG TPA: hypothetical protein VGB02_21490 [Pyrinomonadaceae bacterium]|jgi:hypothetical protein
MSNEEKPRIKDIPKFKKMDEQMKVMKAINFGLPFVNPLLKLFGIETSEIKEALSNVSELEKQFKELSELPDKFNDTFSSRGWITFGALDLNIVKTALSLSETNIDEAEMFLVESYTFEEVKRYLYMMNGVRAFRPRMELAEKALIDYKEERYHACVPVILALTDGLVNELNPQNLGISADNSNLTAWDCITAHEKGLNALKEVIFKTRKTTRTEEITIPYRHGILHGMDLGYANKTVAAKTWALLFAIRDWAEKAEGKMLSEPPPEPPATWTGLINQINEHNQWKQTFDENLNNWKPRNIEIGKNVPKTGNFDDFQDGTPERKLVEFLIYWQKKNYGQMANCIWSMLQLSGNKMPGRVRAVYDSTLLKDFELLEIIDEAPSVTEIRVSLRCESNGNCCDKEVKFRLVINDSSDGKPLMRGMPNATWGIANWGHGN